MFRSFLVRNPDAMTRRESNLGEGFLFAVVFCSFFFLFSLLFLFTFFVYFIYPSWLHICTSIFWWYIIIWWFLFFYVDVSRFNNLVSTHFFSFFGDSFCFHVLFFSFVLFFSYFFLFFLPCFFLFCAVRLRVSGYSMTEAGLRQASQAGTVWLQQGSRYSMTQWVSLFSLTLSKSFILTDCSLRGLISL